MCLYLDNLGIIKENVLTIFRVRLIFIQLRILIKAYQYICILKHIMPLGTY